MSVSLQEAIYKKMTLLGSLKSLPDTGVHRLTA